MENSEQFTQELDFLTETPALGDDTLPQETEEQEVPIRMENLFEQDPAAEPEKPEPSAETPKPTEPQQEEKKSWQKSFLLYLHDFVYLAAALIVVSILLFRFVVVSGTSMYDTLLDGDYLLVLSNTIYTNPKKGDIVVISKDSFDNGNPIVKRVIATEGQTVDIDFNLGIVYVDGVALDEPYTYTATTREEGVDFPLTVEDGCIFVLGDNRGVSHDSRSPDIGLVDVNEVLGKVIFLFLPGTNGTDAFGNPNEPRDWSRIGLVN